MADFHIDATVQSQYAASPHIRALVDAFWAALDPAADIKSIYDNMVNPDTAVGFGLDVWGRIVAIGREFISVNDISPYQSFQNVAKNSRMKPFNQANFYQEVNGKVQLSDEAYRTYIFLKAAINIGDSSLASLNRMIGLMFPDAKIMIQHTDTMTLRVLILTGLSEADKAALFNLPWPPAGVQIELYQVVTPTFGFANSRLNPFNNGTFGYVEPIVIS